MSNKLEKVTESIKSKLSFDDYTPSQQPDIKPSEQKDVVKSKKVKRTFYLDESVVDKLDAFYAKKLSEKKQVDKSDVVAFALEQLLEQDDITVPCY